MAEHTPDAPPGTPYECQRCGWIGAVNGRPRCLPCYAENTRRWRAKYPGKAKDLKRRWYGTAKGMELSAKHKRERRARNPQTSRDAWRRRVEWLRAGDVTSIDLREIWRRDNGCCVYCHLPIGNPRFNPLDPRGFDHVKPRSKGGAHTRSNIVVACKHCNASKSDKEVRCA